MSDTERDQADRAATLIAQELTSVRSRLNELSLRDRRLSAQDQTLRRQLIERAAFLQSELRDLRTRTATR
jgi:hypothetical protein